MATTETVQVHPTNADALRAWDGGDGDYWTAKEAVFDESVARYRDVFFATAAIERADAVLDIGCGTGETTRDAARLAVDGSALGVDLSSRMLERARRRASEEGVANARFLQADAQIHPFGDGTFDVAISRTGAMFFGDPVAAFANIGRAVRPGGRLALLVWQALERNHWIRDFRDALAAGRELPVPPPAAPGPFSLSDPERVQAILTPAGWTDVVLHPAEEPMWFGATADDAFDFVRDLGFTRFLLGDLDADARRRALDGLRATIDAHITDEGVLYPSAAWVVEGRRSAG